MKFLIAALLLAGALVTAAFAFIYTGVFNVAADAPHSRLVLTIIETVRLRSIAARAGDVQPPPLDDAALIATGARHYAAMCSGCHLAPDKKDSEIRAGLSPQPPDLTKPRPANPAQTFWVIKHGIKMSGMPAWGKTHDDASIWGLVAFLRKLPELTVPEYHALADRAGVHDSHDAGHAGHHHHDQ